MNTPIVVGVDGSSRTVVGDLVVGSVVTTPTTRAHCSVAVVRGGGPASEPVPALALIHHAGCPVPVTRGE